MMPTTVRLAFVLASLASCQGTGAPPDVAPATPVASTPAVSPKPVPADAPPPAGALGVARPSGPPGPLVIEPKDNGDGLLPHVPIEPKTETMLSHVGEFGWAADSSAFGLCYDDLDIGTCEVYEPSGKQTASMRFDAKWKAWKERVGGITVGPTTWAYPDVALTWREKKSRLEVGARIIGVEGGGKGKGKRNVVTFRRFDEDWPEAMGMLELVSISPDGAWIALVGHEGLSEVHNEFYVEFRRPRRFAAEAYGAQGFVLLRKGEDAEAAAWFRKATTTDDVWKHPYNLACALSGAGEDTATRAAFEEAIRRGGDVVREKAKTDEDLEHARTLPWFEAAVGG